MREMTATAFGRRITERGVARTHTKKGKIYHGIGLLEEQTLDSTGGSPWGK